MADLKETLDALDKAACHRNSTTDEYRAFREALVNAYRAGQLVVKPEREVVRERLAKTIANAMGDNFSDAFKNKARWVAKRGMSGGRFRDVNEPFQSDYLEAADAALAAIFGDDA
jgi:hypothetical protein